MDIIKNFTKKAFKKVGYGVTKYPVTNDRRKMDLFRLKKIDLILDVGANKGQFAQYMRDIGFVENIISFEPLSEEFEILKKNSENDENWSCENFAFGDFNGETEINIANNSSSSSILEMSGNHLRGAPESFYVDKQKIMVKRLDTYLSEENILIGKNPFLKLDVQGYEKKVIESAGEYLKSFIGIQLELSMIELYNGETTFDEFIKLMNDQGFFISFIEPGLIDMNDGKLLQVDVMFFNSNWKH